MGPPRAPSASISVTHRIDYLRGCEANPELPNVTRGPVDRKVVDRAARTLLGSVIAGPGASEAIHEAVLAIRTRTTLDVLADTIHASPTVARVMGDLFADVVADLDRA